MNTTEEETELNYEQYLAQCKQTCQYFALRKGCEVDYSQVYPLTASQILELMQIRQATDNFITRSEVQIRIFQALVADKASPNPDVIARWLDHVIVIGRRKPTLALASKMLRHLNREASALDSARRWFRKQKLAHERDMAK
ncbi:MAG: hypothetical protein E6J34_14940 [Chloroflexi bacterium]|nr:MAG: hypothetical protein E6J34_14940 [Chloroflexota bacterium]